MKITTIIAAACIAASSLHAAEYSTLADAYKAKDCAWIVAHTNKLMSTKIYMADWTAEQITELADKYAAAGWYNNAYWLKKYMLKDIDGANAELKKLAPSFKLPNGSYCFVEVPSDVDYMRTMLQKFVDLVNSDPAEAVNVPNFMYLATYAYSFNKKYGTDMQLNLTDDLVVASAKKYPVSTPLINIADKQSTAHFAKLQFSNSKFNDKTMYAFALNADKIYCTTEYIEAVFSKMADCRLRSLAAIKLNDPDKLLLALADIKQTTFNADDITAVLKMLNGQKSDWRPDEVKKVLMDINSMYTTKLYDDRNTWEPVLSKLRAMIEIR